MPLSVNDKKAIAWIAAMVLAANVGMYFISSAEPPKEEETRAESPLPHDGDGRHVDKRPFLFDPNTASYETFLSLGLRPNTARAIVNYRKAGGVFRRPEDLSRIYTLDGNDYRRLSPYIRIKDPGHRQERLSAPDTHSHGSSFLPPGTERQAAHVHTSYKLQPGQTVDINTADSSAFLRIPGIGPYYAAKIVRYRNRLGGFVSVSQIREVHGVPDDIGRWLSIANTGTTKLKINRAEFRQLLKHPYFTYDQVVAVFNYRKVYGNIRDINDLANYAAFSQSDFVRLAPYLDYSE